MWKIKETVKEIIYFLWFILLCVIALFFGIIGFKKGLNKLKQLL